MHMFLSNTVSFSPILSLQHVTMCVTPWQRKYDEQR